MTGLLVEHRFENHKNGQKSAWVVRKYGLRLMPELYRFLNPMPFEAAAQMEKDLAEDLRAESYYRRGWYMILGELKKGKFTHVRYRFSLVKARRKLLP